jgi:hypothetical protein
MQFNANIQPTHKHTHLQAAKSRHTNQGLQKSVLLANAGQTTEKGQQLTRYCQKRGQLASMTLLCLT